MSDYSVDPGATIDRLIAERDAALGREAALKDDALTLGCIVDSMGAERDALQQRLTAADERADVLEGLLRNIWHVVPNGYKSEIDAALKPAEGSTCNQVREESGLPVNTPCQACGRGACIDR